MKCAGCGAEDAGFEAANRTVNPDLKGAIEDRMRTGGTCPLCGRARQTPPPRMKNFKAWVVIGSLVVITLVRFAAQYYQSPLRTLPVEEAFQRAQADPKVEAALGIPIRQGHTTKDRISRDETGWSEAKLRIELQGSRSRGTLRVVAGKGLGDWTFSTIEVLVENQPKPLDVLQGKLELTTGPDYQSAHTEPQQSPELLTEPEHKPAWDGSYPVIRIDGPLTWGVRPQHGLAAEVYSVHSAPVNALATVLNSGMFLLRQSDLVVDDVMPLVLTRTYHPWDKHSYAFGLGAGHPYDIAPQGARNPYTYLGLTMEDGSYLQFDRISRGTGYADGVFEYRNAVSDLYRARIWWNGNGWTLHFADGRLFLFPESYFAKTLAQGAAYEMRDAQGNRIRLQRDPDRNLRLLVSPSGHFIRFEYDGQRRITEASDDRGRTVHYHYDAAGRLNTVIDASGRETRYAYQDDRMLTVEDGAGHVLLRNRYENERVAEQTLADGETYHYEYEFPTDTALKTLVTAPDGSKTLFTFDNGILQSRKTLTAASR